jgi:transposase
MRQALLSVVPSIMWPSPSGDPHPVQKFGSFTAELYRMVKWLLDWGVKSVGMPASGVYWIGLYPILEEHGLEVRVTNARYTQRLPGGKSDVQECQGLQKLHPFGLLPAAFARPRNFACCAPTCGNARTWWLA